ncbi:segregation/condensation protein A [Candidatus Woesearchaeota archaeon]|nr:segregation/condensation protein A [Candidatus Woesearchaeota archaeon]MCF7901674.1 segregation/condensation protein A [Candidatus Woesearchaeota archaeon]MCF8013739.1 segregation/condensation protein A [Candidatus Woesearchaeota archaeon]
MVVEAQTFQGHLNKGQGNEQTIINILVDEDELTWQTIIMELIKSEQMDPWNIDVSIISEKFIKLLSKMTKMDFRISGKIILAAAFFLKIKSDKLLNEDIVALDSLIQSNNNPEDLFDLLDDIPDQIDIKQKGEKPVLKYRTPQPRKRKVSVYDLINALEKALKSEQKRLIRAKPAPKMKIPAKSKDMTIIMNDLYAEISKTLKKVKVVWFHEIIIGESREDKITTFLPLLHLDNQRKIDLNQKDHFGDISIKLTGIVKDYS